jgi:hypothetical protein
MNDPTDDQPAAECSHDQASGPDEAIRRGHLDRRRLLGAGAALAGAAAVAAMAGGRPWRRLVRFTDASVDEQLATISPWSPSVQAVGEAYLSARPAERDQAVLLGLLRDDLGLPPGAVPTDLRQTARIAIQRDFTSRRTLRLDGWVASPTEARLAALAVVSGASPR